MNRQLWLTSTPWASTLASVLFCCAALLGCSEKNDAQPAEEKVPVPDLVGMPVMDARKSLEDANLLLQETRKATSGVEEGQVLSQSPNAGDLVAARDVVEIVVATAPAPAAPSWEKLPGAAKDIGVGANGSVWVIGTNQEGGGFGIYRLDGNSWAKVPGSAVRIDVDGQGNPWVVNVFGGIYRGNGSSWQQLPGAAKDIGVGANGTVWVIGTNPVGGGFGIYRLDGNNWANVAGGAVRIDVDPTGNPWVINSGGNIYRWNGSGWQQMPGNALDIGIGGDGSVFVVNKDFNVFKWDGSGWQIRPGGLSEISVDGKGAPWGVNIGGEIYRGTP